MHADGSASRDREPAPSFILLRSDWPMPLSDPNNGGTLPWPGLKKTRLSLVATTAELACPCPVLHFLCFTLSLPSCGRIDEMSRRPFTATSTESQALSPARLKLVAGSV